MNLYHVKRTSQGGYDSYSDFVCVAESEDAARRMPPNYQHGKEADYSSFAVDEEGAIYRFYPWDTPTPHAASERDYGHREWESSIDRLVVALLGAAASYETVPRVVCASYHAG